MKEGGRTVRESVKESKGDTGLFDVCVCMYVCMYVYVCVTDRQVTITQDN